MCWLETPDLSELRNPKRTAEASVQVPRPFVKRFCIPRSTPQNTGATTLDRPAQPNRHPTDSDRLKSLPDIHTQQQIQPDLNKRSNAQTAPARTESSTQIPPRFTDPTLQTAPNPQLATAPRSSFNKLYKQPHQHRYRTQHSSPTFFTAGKENNTPKVPNYSKSSKLHSSTRYATILPHYSSVSCKVCLYVSVPRSKNYQIPTKSLGDPCSQEGVYSRKKDNYKQI